MMPTAFDPAKTFDSLETLETLPGATTLVDEFPATHFDPVDHGGDWLTTTLPMAALDAFDLFADLESLPVWLPIIGRVHVHRRDALERPSWVSFLADLDRGSVGYSLCYDYQPEILGIRWTTPPGANLAVSGWVRFSTLGPSACLMEYQLRVDRGAMPAWRDPFYDNHAPSAVIHHFREYVHRRQASV